MRLVALFVLSALWGRADEPSRFEPVYNFFSQSVTLSWVVSNATSLRIDQGVGPVTGLTSTVVYPTTTTTYTLFATNSAGTVSKSCTVRSLGPPPCRIFPGRVGCRGELHTFFWDQPKTLGSVLLQSYVLTLPRRLYALDNTRSGKH